MPMVEESRVNIVIITVMQKPVDICKWIFIFGFGIIFFSGKFIEYYLTYVEEPVDSEKTRNYPLIYGQLEVDYLSYF